jgi:methionyl-tRNA formyltransferase
LGEFTLRIVYFGSEEFAVPSLRWLVNSKHELVEVVTEPDRAIGPEKTGLPTPVAVQAAEEGLRALFCEDVNAPDFVKQIKSLKADLGIVASFGQKLSSSLRAAFSGGCISMHGSLLPKYRGPDPTAWAILNGEAKTGVTIFRIVDQLYAGPILVQRETLIGPMETCEELDYRLARIACDAIDAALKALDDNLQFAGELQEDSQAIEAPKLKESDGYLHFDEPAESIALRCRAMWPWPGGRCLYFSASGRSEEVVIIITTPILTDENIPPGTVTPEYTVATAQGALKIHEIEASDKRILSWEAFVENRHVKPGDRFQTIH